MAMERPSFLVPLKDVPVLLPELPPQAATAMTAARAKIAHRAWFRRLEINSSSPPWGTQTPVCQGNDRLIVAAHAACVEEPLASRRYGGGVRLPHRPPRPRGTCAGAPSLGGNMRCRCASGSRTHSFVRSTFLLCPTLFLPPPGGGGLGWGGRTCRHDSARRPSTKGGRSQGAPRVGRRYH